MATIEDFASLGLKTAKVLDAKRVEGSDKLLQLKVDLGQEQRQIIAGIGKSYAPEDLIGKVIVVASNLEPRSIVGLESQGMLLAADRGGEPVLVRPEQETEPGTAVK